MGLFLGILGVVFSIFVFLFWRKVVDPFYSDVRANLVALIPTLMSLVLPLEIFHRSFEWSHSFLSFLGYTLVYLFFFFLNSFVCSLIFLFVIIPFLSILRRL